MDLRLGKHLMSNVKIFTGVTPIDFDADVILQAAMGKLKNVVIIGEFEDGDEFFSSSLGSGPEIIWMIERAKLELLRTVD